MKKGDNFFTFLDQWGKYVHNQAVIKDSVPWDVVPGYNKLIA